MTTVTEADRELAHRLRDWPCIHEPDVAAGYECFECTVAAFASAREAGAKKGIERGAHAENFWCAEVVKVLAAEQGNEIARQALLACVERIRCRVDDAAEEPDGIAAAIEQAREAGEAKGREDEREDCAKLCDATAQAHGELRAEVMHYGGENAAKQCAAIIRARGEKP